MTTNNATKKTSLMNKFINVIEKGGNKLPHPFILFFDLVIITMIASWICSKLGFSVTYYGVSKVVGEAGKTITVNVENLLSSKNLEYLFVKFPDIIVSYVPLRLVLMMMIASAFIEKTGFFETFMKKYLLKAPKSLVTFAVVFMSINANLMSDAGTMFALTMGGIIFVALGRNPLIGAILGFVGASGGFTANFFLAGTDALLAGITENAVAGMGGNFAVNPAMNYFFMASATVIMSLTVTIFTEKVVVKILGDNDGQVSEELLSQHKLTPDQEKGLKWALYGFIVFLILMGLMTVPDHAFLRNAQNSFLPKSPLFKGIISVISLLFLLTGIPYGIATKKITKAGDIPRIISSGINQSIPFLTTTVSAAVFIDLLGKSNMFKILAIKGANLLKTGNVSLITLCVLVILITTVINPFMSSGSSKWLLLAPMVVPMFTILHVHPAYAQLAFRIGDSCTNIISPLHSALPVLIGILADYQAEGKIPLRPGEKEHREIGMGTIFSLTIPYSIVLLLTMTAMLIAWILFDLPIGPGVPLNI